MVADGSDGKLTKKGQRRSAKTFRPKKNLSVGAKGAHLKNHIAATLGRGDLRDAVRLPPGEDLNEWLAVNTVDFYNAINMIYGVLSEWCTSETCPVMSAGEKYEYHWADGVKIKRPVQCSAPEYVDYLMDWIETLLEDERVFPQRVGDSFPSDFRSTIVTIFRRLFRVYAHIYHSHFQQMVSVKMDAHLNTNFKHFIFFVKHFQLVGSEDLVPLQELIDTFERK